MSQHGRLGFIKPQQRGWIVAEICQSLTAHLFLMSEKISREWSGHANDPVHTTSQMSDQPVDYKYVSLSVTHRNKLYVRTNASFSVKQRRHTCKTKESWNRHKEKIFKKIQWHTRIPGRDPEDERQDCAIQCFFRSIWSRIFHTYMHDKKYRSRLKSPSLFCEQIFKS